MKRQILFGIITLALFASALTVSLAQESVPFTPTPSPTPVEYELPYPGILPDHPLYVFKMIRDKLLITLISHPIKQVEFHILLADKHLNMSTFLADKNKDTLAVSALEKSIDHLTHAKEKLFQISPDEAVHTNNLKDRMEKSLLKHAEVITLLEQSIEDTKSTQQLSELHALLQVLHEDFDRNK